MNESTSPSDPRSPSHTFSSWAAVLLYRNHRVSSLLLILVFGAGCIALVQMPKLEDPPLSQRGVTITTLLPGADAGQVEAQVTEKIETQLLELPELKKLRSQSRSGASVITFEIKDSVADPELVFARLRSKVQDAKASLPARATEPIVEAIEVSAYAWIGAVVCDASTATSSPGLLRRLALLLSDQLREIPQTKQADLLGEPDEEITVEIDPARAAQLGLSIAEIARSLSQGDAKQSAGTLVGQHQDVNVRIANQFESIQEIAGTHIRDAGEGRVLLLSDVASVRRGVRLPANSLAIVDGQPAVIVAARPELGCSVDGWTRAVQAKLLDFEKAMPRGVRLETLLVQNDYVTQRMLSLLVNLLVGLLAVAMTTVVFLGWRSALLVTATLPIGCFMVLAGLQWLRIPLHQMSVTGVILSLGLMIDNAIIVVDELGQFLRRGLRGMDAMIQTCRRLAMPLLGSTATTALAFVPLAFMPGPTGEFVGSIGVAVILSVVSSLLIALTLLPALATNVLQRSPQTLSIQGMRVPRIERAFAVFLRRILSRPGEGLLLGAILPVVGFVVAIGLPEQFFPAAERDQFMIDLELDASATIQDTVGQTRLLDAALAEHSPIAQVSWLVGGTAPAFYYNHIPLKSNTPSYAQAIVRTHDRVASRKFLSKLQNSLNQAFTNARVTVRQFEQGPPTNAPIELRVLGNDLIGLQRVGETIKSILLANPGVMQVRSDMSEMRPIANVQLDPQRLRASGLDEQSVGAQLYSQLDGLTAGSLIEQTEELPVRIRTVNRNTETGSPLKSLSIVANGPSLPGSVSASSSRPRSMPIEALGNITLCPERAVITRFNGQRVNELQAFLPVGQLPSLVLKQLSQRLTPEKLDLPFGYRFEFGGEVAERAAAVSSLVSYVPSVTLAGFVVLVLSLQSFRMAFIIAVIGFLSIGLGTGSLWLLGYPIGFTAIIGILGLIGVAINDSIVVLTALREDPQARGGDVEAMLRTVLDCTRHVLCTTFTTVFGFLPLILSGGTFWPPLAVVIGCGITGATVTALTFLPCLYRVLAQQRGVSPFDKLSADSALEERIYDQVHDIIADMPLASARQPTTPVRRVRDTP